MAWDWSGRIFVRFHDTLENNVIFLYPERNLDNVLSSTHIDVAFYFACE